MASKESQENIIAGIAETEAVIAITAFALFAVLGLLLAPLVRR